MSTLQPVKKSNAKPRINSAFKQLMSIHWIMASCYLILFVSGSSMARLPDELFFRDPVYEFHKSIAIVTVALLTWRILTLLRVWWSKYTKRPPKLTKEWWKTFALHTSLYIFMWAVPVTGFFLSNSYRSNNVKFFGILVPDIFPQNSAIVGIARSSHFWFAYTFLAFILIHILMQWKVVRANYRRFLGFVKANFAKA
ncbi:cytochrome B [Nostocales cyanobacterium HT-58-2]|nr:cytochrome B [Nostocales cyanobacterium HT-58-2]